MKATGGALWVDRDYADSYSFRDLRQRIASWIAHVAPGPGEDPRNWGIAGKLDSVGRARYFYGEITGYWLRWAALYAPDAEKMGCAVDWLARQWSEATPALTRVGANGDWRNQAVFSFDLAMILQGLGDAAPIVGEAKCAAVAARLTPWLEQMIDADGFLNPCLVLQADGLPARWSTRQGPFQAKTAAGILSVAKSWLPAPLLASAERTQERWSDCAGEHKEMHARCYSLEGGLRGGGGLDSLLLLGPMGASGVVPEEVGVAGSIGRADVQAQVLRLLSLMADVGDATLRVAASALREHVRADGSVSFRIGGSDANVWCAMFAHQALDWFCRRGEPSERAPSVHDLI